MQLMKRNEIRSTSPPNSVPATIGRGLGLLALGAALTFGFACRTAAPAPAPPPASPPPATTAPPPPPPATSQSTTDHDDLSSADAALHDRVHEALDAAPQLDGTDISVRVQNGVVYLGGWVRTAEQKDIAHNVAHSVEGVEHVDYDDIDVRG